MADYNINLVNKLNKSNFSGTGNKNSVQSKKQELQVEKQKFDLGSKAKNVSRVMSSAQSGKGEFLGGFKGVGVISTVVVTTLKIANKAADLAINYHEAKTGNSVRYGNIRSSKELLLSLGTNYLSGLVKNELFTKNIVRRQNTALDYGRQLYNYNNYGEKYRTR